MKPLILRLEHAWHSSWLTPRKADLESTAVLIARSCNFHKTHLTGCKSTQSRYNFSYQLHFFFLLFSVTLLFLHVLSLFFVCSRPMRDLELQGKIRRKRIGWHLI